MCGFVHITGSPEVEKKALQVLFRSKIEVNCSYYKLIYGAIGQFVHWEALPSTA
jgi:hypothetical protein